MDVDGEGAAMVSANAVATTQLSLSDRVYHLFEAVGKPLTQGEAAAKLAEQGEHPTPKQLKTAIMRARQAWFASHPSQKTCEISDFDFSIRLDRARRALPGVAMPPTIADDLPP